MVDWVVIFPTFLFFFYTKIRLTIMVLKIVQNFRFFLCLIAYQPL